MIYQCDHNIWVQCEKKECDKCGWNPEVAQARMEDILRRRAEELGEKHG